MTLLPTPPPAPRTLPREKHIFRTLHAATSTSWPGICGLGVWILCVALLISCGYFGTILALGIKLLKMGKPYTCPYQLVLCFILRRLVLMGRYVGDHVQCRLPSSFPSDPAFSQKLPVTYTAFDGTTRVGNMGEQMSKMYLHTLSSPFPPISSHTPSLPSSPVFPQNPSFLFSTNLHSPFFPHAMC